jgi:hypothetical protein
VSWFACPRRVAVQRVEGVGCEGGGNCITEEKDNPDPKPKARHRIGFLQGKIKVPDDFDTIFQAEIKAMFYGSDEETE